MGLSVAFGAAVSGANLGVARWLAGRIEEAAGNEEEPSHMRWAVLLGFKTFVLMAIAAVAVLVVGIDPFGFIGGYSLFLVALGWQTIEWNLES